MKPYYSYNIKKLDYHTMVDIAYYKWQVFFAKQELVNLKLKFKEILNNFGNYYDKSKNELNILYVNMFPFNHKNDLVNKLYWIIKEGSKEFRSLSTDEMLIVTEFNNDLRYDVLYDLRYELLTKIENYLKSRYNLYLEFVEHNDDIREITTNISLNLIIRKFELDYGILLEPHDINGLTLEQHLKDVKEKYPLLKVSYDVNRKYIIGFLPIMYIKPKERQTPKIRQDKIINKLLKDESFKFYYEN